MDLPPTVSTFGRQHDTSGSGRSDLQTASAEINCIAGQIASAVGRHHEGPRALRPPCLLGVLKSFNVERIFRAR